MKSTTACAEKDSDQKACAYVRTNRDDSAQSIDFQQKAILELAAKHRCQIVQWYCDEACSGSRNTEKRADWMRLLNDAPSAEWKVVLIYSRSRFSRLDTIKEGFAKQVLREAGKTLHACVEGPMEWHPARGRIIDTIHAEGHYDYSRRLGIASLQGKLQAFLAGKSYGRKCPYGMARRIADPLGNVHEVNRNQKFTMPEGWAQTLVPGDPQEVQTVKRLFKDFPTKGCRQLARLLNAEGVPSPVGRNWSAHTVYRILANPVYVGDTAFGRMAVGKFARVSDGKVVENESRKGVRQHDWLLRKGTHRGLIDRATWNRVQAKLRSNVRRDRNKR